MRSSGTASLFPAYSGPEAWPTMYGSPDASVRFCPDLAAPRSQKASRYSRKSRLPTVSSPWLCKLGHFALDLDVRSVSPGDPYAGKGNIGARPEGCERGEVPFDS